MNYHHYRTSIMFIYSNLNYSFFFFNDTATTEIYTLSLHDALPHLFDDEADRERGADDAVGAGTRSARRSGGEVHPVVARSTRLRRRQPSGVENDAGRTPHDHPRSALSHLRAHLRLH